MGEFVQTIRSATVCLPALELTALLILLGFCLVFRWSRVGLMAAYLFSYKWAWALFTSGDQRYAVIYFIFGGFVALIAVIGLLKSAAGDRDE